MNLFKKLFSTGELPTVNTEVDVNREAINHMALMLVIVAVIIILFYKATKKV